MARRRGEPQRFPEAAARRAFAATRPSRLAAASVLAVVLVTLAADASAQLVRGVVVDAETRTPLPAVLVTLADAFGVDRRRVLVGDDGAFELGAPGSGLYSLRLERLGAEPATLDSLRLDRGDTVTVRVPMRARAVMLDGLEVRADARCELPERVGASTQRVWELARHALRAASATEATGAYRFDLVKHVRELDPVSLTVRETKETRTETARRRPIVSRSVDILLDSGFVVPEAGGSYRYLAPDADALLSERFLATHCFELRQGSGEEAGLIGLTFRPLRDRSGLPDIAGVLWLDRRDGALRRLEYRYTSLPGAAGEIRSDRIGGRVEFRGLPDGRWIVSRWAIRMPRAVEAWEPVVRRRRVRLEGIVEEGGRVERVRRGGTREVVYAEEAVTVHGRVERPAGPPPDPSDSVLVIGLGARAAVDAQGRFRIDGVPEGRYHLAYLRPALMGLDRAYPVAELTVARGDPRPVAVLPPPYEELLASVCSVDAWGVERAVVTGEVVDTRTGRVGGDVRVEATWQRVEALDVNRGRAEVSELSLATRSDAHGAFRLCGVPTGRSVLVVATSGERASPPVRLEIPYGQPVRSVVLDLPAR